MRWLMRACLFSLGPLTCMLLAVLGVLEPKPMFWLGQSCIVLLAFSVCYLTRRT